MLNGQAGSSSVRESSWCHRTRRVLYNHGLVLSSLPGQEGLFLYLVGLNLQGAGGPHKPTEPSWLLCRPSLLMVLPPHAVTLLRVYEQTQGTRFHRSKAIADRLWPFHKGVFFLSF